MLTLNIEDDAIRIAVFKGKKASFAAEIPITAGWVQNGVVIDKLAVGQHIIKVLLENQINDKDVVACVSATHSIYRVVYVPKLDRALLAEAARKEMERVSPVPIDSLYTSWQDVKTSDVEVGLCLLGLPQDNVDSVTDTVTIAGLKLKSLELKPLVVSRVIDEATAIVVNVQTNGFDITIVVNGIPELIRNLSFPQETMPETDRIEILKEELARTVNFYNSSHNEWQLGNNTPCYISGQIQSGIVQDIGYSIKLLPDLASYPASVDVSKFAVNTGLMFREASGKSKLMKVDINCMPRVVAAVKTVSTRPNTTPLIALIIGVLIIIAVFILSTSATREVSELQLMIAQQQKLINETQTSIAQQSSQGAEELDQYKRQLTSLKAPLEYLQKQRMYSNRDLGTVTSLLPAIMYLTDISDDGNNINLEGISPSSELIMDYARDLRKSGNFSDVSITSLTNQSYSDFIFTISITLKR